jgi:spore germination protein GerM
MSSSRKWALGMVVFTFLFIAGIAGGYLLFVKGMTIKTKDLIGIVKSDGEFTYLKVYYPFEGRLQMEERRVQRVAARILVAEATVGEFLKGPAGIKASYIPEDIDLLGIYPGQDGILYIDFSDEFRRNFQGDALAEFLLLRGLYESLLSNVYNVRGVKVLVEGKETESIGGHISLLRPLGEVVSQTVEEYENNRRF